MKPTIDHKATMTKIPTIPQIMNCFPSVTAFSSSAWAINFTSPQKNMTTAMPIKTGMILPIRSMRSSRISSTPSAKARLGKAAAISVVHPKAAFKNLAPKAAFGCTKRLPRTNFLDIIHQIRIRADRTDKEAHNAEHRDHDEHPDDAPEHRLLSVRARFFIVRTPNIFGNAPDKVEESESEKDRNNGI